MNRYESGEIRRLAAPLRQQVADVLRDAIITGRLAPGERLTERALTDMTGVSRTVVRESLRQLETEGLVEIIPNKGPVVRALTVSEAEDLYRIRAVLEGLCARLCVEKATDALIEKLEQMLQTLADAYARDLSEAVLETKNLFYGALYEGAGSEILGTMLGTLLARIWRWRALGVTHPLRSPRRSHETIENLRAMVGAIRRRDADAAERIAQEGVARAAEEVVRLLREGEE